MQTLKKRKIYKLEPNTIDQGGGDAHSSNQEDTAYEEFLCPSHLQLPHNGNWNQQDGHIRDHINTSVADIEIVEVVDASSSIGVCKLCPVVWNWSAANQKGDYARDKISSRQEHAEPDWICHAEDTAVEKNDR